VRPIAVSNVWHGAKSAVTEAAEGGGQYSAWVLTEWTANPAPAAKAAIAIVARYWLFMAMALHRPHKITAFVKLGSARPPLLWHKVVQYWAPVVRIDLAGPVRTLPACLPLPGRPD